MIINLITEDDISDDEDDVSYDFVIEEETQYEHYRAYEKRPKKSYEPVIDWDKHFKHLHENPIVKQEEESTEYEFKFIDLFDIYFGYLTGALNTMPVKSDLNICGKNLRAQYVESNNMLESIEDRVIDDTLQYIANVLFYVNYTSVPCYFGAKEVLLNEQWG